jgi:hypothetical protein
VDGPLAFANLSPIRDGKERNGSDAAAGVIGAFQQGSCDGFNIHANIPA